MKLESIGLLDTFFDKDLFEGSCLEVIPAIIVEWDNTDIGVIDWLYYVMLGESLWRNFIGLLIGTCVASLL